MHDLYQKNEDFKGYVDRYAACLHMPVEEALTHAMVGCYAEYLKERGGADVHID